MAFTPELLRRSSTALVGNWTERHFKTKIDEVRMGVVERYVERSGSPVDALLFHYVFAAERALERGRIHGLGKMP